MRAGKLLPKDQVLKSQLASRDQPLTRILRAYVVAGTDGLLELATTPKDMEHVFDIIIEDEILSFKHITSNKYIGIAKKQILGLVDEPDKQQFQLNLKVFISSMNRSLTLFDR